MARFVHAEYPTEHAGVVRFTRGFTAIAAAVRGFDGARGTATLLLAALVSAMIVVANELVTTWTEGHLLAAWTAAWLVGFAALAMLAGPARRVAIDVRGGLRRWSAARTQRAEDDKVLRAAMADARIMADLARAMSRDATPLLPVQQSASQGGAQSGRDQHAQ